MDITKVITTAIENAAKDLANKSFDNLHFPALDEKLEEDVKQNRMLMNYSTQLLATYHDALREELKDQGISI